MSRLGFISFEFRIAELLSELVSETLVVRDRCIRKRFYLTLFDSSEPRRFLQVNVRAEAAKLLGEFSRVSDSFLDQTLDRKMMKTMKVGTGLIIDRDLLLSYS